MTPKQRDQFNYMRNGSDIHWQKKYKTPEQT